MIAVEVKLWGTTIGALSMLEGEQTARFEYAPNFIGAGIEPSPIVMPVSKQIYSSIKMWIIIIKIIFIY